MSAENTSIEDSDVLHRSCLCRAVTYEVRGGVGNVLHCHCSMCRKAHGAAFGTYAPVGWSAFTFVRGEDMVQRYRSSDDVHRSFCSVCGSTLQFIREGRAGFALAVGTLDSDPIRRPTAQIFAAHKAPWWDLPDSPPAYDTYPSQQPD